MMLREPPALHDEGVSALFAHEDDGHALLRPIALGHRIRAERFHVPRVD
jgi:hypothetical protein